MIPGEKREIFRNHNIRVFVDDQQTVFIEPALIYRESKLPRIKVTSNADRLLVIVEEGLLTPASIEEKGGFIAIPPLTK